MCSACLSKALPASVSAGIGMTLLVSAAASVWAAPLLTADTTNTIMNLLKFAVAFFLLGLGKAWMHEGMQKHMKASETRKR